MVQTSLSLLERLSIDSDNASWAQLVELYGPLLRHWLRRYDVAEADCDDLIQDVLLVVSRELPEFRHNRRTGAFRSWLRKILANRVQNHWRARKRRPMATGRSTFAEQLNQLEDDDSNCSRMWDAEHDRQVIEHLLSRSADRFAPTTWQAFHRLMIDGLDADAVAAELGITVNAVYIAKSRVLSALRRDAAGLID